MTDTPAPLTGVRVVVTRPSHQAAGLLAAFRAAGAHAEPLPLIEVGPPDDPAPLERAARDIAAYHWIAFASANAVDALFGRLSSGLPAAVSAAAVGPATAEARRRHDVEPALVAEDRLAEGLATELSHRIAPGTRVLLPQPPDARPTLAEELTRAGAGVHTVIAYTKHASPHAPTRARALFGDEVPLGWVTFTSPAIARAFAALFGYAWPTRRLTLRAASIGPVTSTELRRLGVEPAAEAAAPGDTELVAAVAAAQPLSPS